MKLKNNTGATSRVGFVVKADPKESNAFIYATASDTNVLGIVVEAVPFRSQAEIVFSGKTKVYVSDRVNPSDIIRLLKAGDNISVGSCRKAKTADKPYTVIGTATKTGSGLVDVLLAFSNIGTEVNYVPYSGATSDVDLGTKDLTATDVNATNLYSATARIGGATNNVTIGTGGELSLNGTATQWEDENMGSASLGAGASAPDLVALNGGSIMVRSFDGNATTEQLFGEIEIPHKTKFPSAITFHLHWCPTTADAGNVKWNLTYVLQADGETIPTETTISVVVAANGTAWKMQMSNFPTINVTALGKQLIFRLWRNPGDTDDTYGQDAAISGSVGFHFEIDSLGSREITTK